MGDTPLQWSEPWLTQCWHVLGAVLALGGLPGCSPAADDGGGAAARPGSGGSGGINVGCGGAGSGFGDSGAGAGCEKIDFLFVVDNSVSMEDEQAQLIAAFPGFIDAIESTVHAGANYHVMVADTDEWGRCDTANPWLGATPSSATCNAYVEGTVFERTTPALSARRST